MYNLSKTTGQLVRHGLSAVAKQTEINNSRKLIGVWVKLNRKMLEEFKFF